MAFQPWKELEFIQQKDIDIELQWSHGFSAMERTRSPTPPPQNAHASMEPWLFSHGKLEDAPTFFFVTKLQWSHGFSAMERQIMQSKDH